MIASSVMMMMPLLQEFMIAMECFFFEWYPDRDDEGSFGRVHVSNNTAAVETSMREGGVSSAPHTCPCSSRPHGCTLHAVPSLPMHDPLRGPLPKPCSFTDDPLGIRWHLLGAVES